MEGTLRVSFLFQEKHPRVVQTKDIVKLNINFPFNVLINKGWSY